MTDTEEQPRELAARALSGVATRNGFRLRELRFDMADAVLAAVTPVIRRQVAEEIAQKIDEKAAKVREESWTPSAGLALAALVAEGAAIARSHSTQPTGEETNG